MAFRALDLPPRLEEDQSLALPTLLRMRAQTRPESVFLQHTDGNLQTYGQLERQVRRWMARLRHLGVAPGDRVMTLLPPSFAAVAVWMACARLAAIETPANTALRGEFLAHVVRDCSPRCVVAHARFAPLLDTLDADVSPLDVVVPDPETGTPSASEGEFDGEEHVPRPHDVATMVYTSGTSGRSKGVVVPWAQQYATARWLMPVDGRENDVWYGPWAMFHVSGKVGLYSSALLDGRLVLRDGFSTSQFWPDVRRFEVTSTMIVASTVSFLSQRPPSTDDRDHTLRHVCAAPLPEQPEAFARRFGVRLCTLFNMTETASPIVTGWDDFPPGSCGKARPGIQTRVVDGDGYDVATGETGELVLRSTAPHEIMGGYWQAPQATVEAWRDLWFHTGDAVRQDEHGRFYFVDRIIDTIRRGGENISSAELEAAVTTHPLVSECAAVGVPTSSGDREVKLFVVPRPGLEPAELAEFLQTRLPRYMRPSAISVIDALPKTHTARVKKVELRAMHDDQPAWVRSPAGPRPASTPRPRGEPT